MVFLYYFYFILFIYLFSILILKARPWQQLDCNKRADPDGVHGSQGTSPKYQVSVCRPSSKLLWIQPFQCTKWCCPNIQWVKTSFSNYSSILGEACSGQLGKDCFSNQGCTCTPGPTPGVVPVHSACSILWRLSCKQRFIKLSCCFCVLEVIARYFWISAYWLLCRLHAELTSEYHGEKRAKQVYWSSFFILFFELYIVHV